MFQFVNNIKRVKTLVAKWDKKMRAKQQMELALVKWEIAILFENNIFGVFTNEELSNLKMLKDKNKLLDP